MADWWVGQPMTLWDYNWGKEVEQLWRDEVELIKKDAARYGLAWHFIAAIRKVENGGAGREFGILSVSAPNYADQLRVCCQTVRHRLLQYDQDSMSLFPYTAPNGDIVVIYSPAFIDWFAEIWAPKRNWSNNLKYWYLHLIDAEHQVVGSEVYGREKVG